ncbi:acyl-CoA N-acyltransferase [Mollisia scopiformis]|uniref:Acyl-CoA N-acyltransferase n=1 Tax=Mollisia scopiformis TaxID=149040 RepID=A0A194XKK1_MOLSC|nr:acyl-CoA N-acyltransferase [Mollisia scopiformis]KUJ20317.1 acyl-CoA N-acyltransferase [Mollisia scopiformis]
MAPETFTLSECTKEDVPAMIQVYLSSFASDYFGQFVFPKATISDEERHRWLTYRFTTLFTKREVRSFKITENSTGKMAAFLRWTFPIVLTEEEQLERKKEKAEKERVMKETGHDPTWPRGANLALTEEKFGGLERMMDKYVDKKEMYVANLLGTDPAYQRKGLASRLLKHVLDMADREGRKVYIEATPAGHPVYLKLGFKDVDIVKVDLSRWGGKEIGTNRIMIRDPEPAS